MILQALAPPGRTVKGGPAVGSALEGLKNTEAGAAILNAVTGSGGSK